jgi:hypothetical protein
MPYADRTYAIQRNTEYYWKNKPRLKTQRALGALKTQTAMERGKDTVLKLLQDAAVSNKSKRGEGSETGGGDGEGPGGGVGVS